MLLKIQVETVLLIIQVDTVLLIMQVDAVLLIIQVGVDHTGRYCTVTTATEDNAVTIMTRS